MTNRRTTRQQQQHPNTEKRTNTSRMRSTARRRRNRRRRNNNTIVFVIVGALVVLLGTTMTMITMMMTPLSEEGHHPCVVVSAAAAPPSSRDVTIDDDANDDDNYDADNFDDDDDDDDNFDEDNEDDTDDDYDDTAEDDEDRVVEKGKVEEEEEFREDVDNNDTIDDDEEEAKLNTERKALEKEQNGVLRDGEEKDKDYNDNASAETQTMKAKKKALYMEPDVRIYHNVMSPDDCSKIIAVSEAIGYPLEHDSIDEEEARFGRTNNTASQAMDIVDEGMVIRQHAVWEILQPYVPAIAKLIINQRDTNLHAQIWPDQPDLLPQLDWVFARKYSPTSSRNALVPHTDTNMHTVNIALNHDFHGGGLFYVKPPIALNKNWITTYSSSYNVDDHVGRYTAAPQLKYHQATYDWVNTLNNTGRAEVAAAGADDTNKAKRMNSATVEDVVFPNLHTGDALIHNYTVWHGIAPLDTGTRYSLVLFFDMDNPMLQKELLPSYDDEETTDNDEDYFNENEYDGFTEIGIEHEIMECYQGEIRDVPSIDILWVNESKEALYFRQQRRLDRAVTTTTTTNNNNDESKPKKKNTIQYLETVHTSVIPHETVFEYTEAGQVFRAVRSQRTIDGATNTNADGTVVEQDVHDREALAEFVVPFLDATDTDGDEDYNGNVDEDGLRIYELLRTNAEHIIQNCGKNDNNTEDDDDIQKPTTSAATTRNNNISGDDL